ncbi:DUF6366 family protein [Jeotgalibacillus proteolyticus]|uniref:Phage capsid protein n=1 Tax=Jeotgalibacillus proteolyticus TaxID=2082395 RepID=A0A2S5G9L5_9BACL|nr:DUF6366 family protein [Jeotgalibacillus proteolyticus]PPA69611.1 hypothetical protein C4B60_13770 [Jeotgalibacillus proteolyticus]
MSGDKETPEERREKMRMKELKHTSSSIQGSNLSDLVNSLGWKGTGILILVLIAGVIIASLFLW